MRLTTQVTTLTSRGAEVALKAAIDEAERMNIRLCVAVVDRAGHLLAFRRMDGAPPPSIDVATAKAQTAALFGVPSKTFQTMVNEGQAAILAVRTLAPLEGGVPIAVDGVVIGAVGASGAAASDDAAAAQAGVDALVALCGESS